MSFTKPAPVAPPRIDRIRHELKRRTLRVERVGHVTPGMVRIDFSGEDLADFVSLAPDDHIKIFLPDGSGGVERRDYTPRRFDLEARSLAIDFAVHDAGPATAWALRAKVGDPLEIGGPRGSAVVSPDVRTWLLIGDETALPAMGRRIEEAEAGSAITAIGLVAGPDEHQMFTTRAALKMHWVHRPLSAATDARPVIDMLQGLELLPETFVWVAAEATVVREVRAYLVGTRGHALGWLKASGYWVKGEADAHESFD